MGAKTATVLLPAHLESRLSGSAERLAPSLHPSTHLSIPLPQLLHPLPSSSICPAAKVELKFKIFSHFFLSPTHFLLLLSSLLAPKEDKRTRAERHRAHVEDITEGIIIPPFLKAGVHKGTFR